MTRQGICNRPKCKLKGQVQVIPDTKLFKCSNSLCGAILTDPSQRTQQSVTVSKPTWKDMAIGQDVDGPVVVNVTGGTASFHLFAKKARTKKNLLLIAHGRQAPGELATKLLNRIFSIAFAVPSGSSLVREEFVTDTSTSDYDNKLLACVKTFVGATSEFMSLCGVPLAYLGPHFEWEIMGDRDNGKLMVRRQKEIGKPISVEQALFHVMEICDIAIFTDLKLAEPSKLKGTLDIYCSQEDYQHRYDDQKVPLHEILTSNVLGAYDNFLLMACRSSWGTSKSSEHLSGPTGILYSYDDKKTVSVRK